MSVLTVCKNVIAANNKRHWKNPDPSIRVAGSKSGRVLGRGNHIDILDSRGNIVASLLATTDGQPIVKCGAKVALVTEYPVKIRA